MVDEELKFRSETFRIIGFALFTPFGKAFLDFIPMLKEWGIMGFLIYFLISVLLVYVGVILIVRAWVLLLGSEKKI